MDFNSKHKDAISKLELDPSADYTQDDNHFALYDAASSVYIKKGFDKDHKSFDYFKDKYQVKMNDRYIIYTKDLAFEDGVLYIPVYMTMFL